MRVASWNVNGLRSCLGKGFAEWLAWLEVGCAAQQSKKQETVASLKRRIAELEAKVPVSGRC